MKNKEKEATQEETPVVANTQEHTTQVENIEVVGAEVINPETNATILGVKVTTSEETGEVENTEFLPLKLLSFISRDRDDYQITVPKFRFKGQEYDSQIAINETPEVLEVLIEANSFFIKKI